ncbi:MAG: DNA-directed RNA polymerase subunit alpha [Helicobacter sp.]|uniref:DNA-directed RNA polymerase subunit alpha n=1 Tax=Helicobacter sp. 10-6591 TaxID=2004998 RepID=UPI000DCDBCF2|nr:DNA-directed RNA polymerase subunit alpha [Helicobacter sp. 10-6591]MCI6217534.1 DNA-directed RNA polymerase subunit alpha [Helicobacter sp.]MCI7485352.1 DNA-directed RNA polymerase subunit alpha [Helicobacter sp.]MDD7567494.1 DNA-directed RNA polymerase subunit alpha [Helicobacter sp.]MDY5741018.1 DNA-directed RNA polymerase subunit alpha [Helicobacter sp.]RAX54325.1 DNA-directed RNA polymerase subunit alpha [Helicobacter sp. 10-6591]
MKVIKTEPYIPENIDIVEVGVNHITISVWPFEAGYAITFAHPLRRLLLSSSVGYAAVALKIEGVSHEFDSIRGIVEDVAQFIANLKNVRFLIKDKTNDETVELSYIFNGPMVLTSRDLTNEFTDIVNPDVYLATINEDFSLNISLIVKKGIGYVPSEAMRTDVADGYITLDAYFTPVKKAVYEISNILLEDNPNFEKLVFDIETDGQIKPMDAFKDAIAIMYKQMSIFGVELSEAPVPSKNVEDSHELRVLLTPIDCLNLSARCFNCLDRAGIKYVGELTLMQGDEIKNIKNMGKKSYDEIADKLQELGYPIGVELSNSTATLFSRKLAKLKA